MIIYEINVVVDNNMLTDYLSWLKKHTQHITNFPGFIDSCLFTEITEEDHESEKSKLVVHYRIKNYDFLQNYFDNHAKQMREEGIKLFNDKVFIRRRIMEVSDCFKNNAR